MHWRRGYDRTRLLSQAARAREKGRRRVAIKKYREVLAREPENVELHRAVAPLLAQVGRRAEAWVSYAKVGQRLVSQGYWKHAEELYREAKGYFPDEAELWVAMADLEVRRDRPREAERTLRTARERYRSWRRRAQAVIVLERLLALRPHDLEVAFDLACQHGNRRDWAPARGLLDALVERARGDLLRRVVIRQVIYFPEPRTIWRFLRVVAGRQPAAA
jgi:tetratricopeptide (TPR) repeat protein